MEVRQRVSFFVHVATGGEPFATLLTPLPVVDSSLLFIATIMPEQRHLRATSAQVELDQAVRKSSPDDNPRRVADLLQ
jgi:hypothetical protein